MATKTTKASPAAATQAAAVAAHTAPSTTVMYTLGGKAAQVVARPTLQRGCPTPVGKAWRATAVSGTNTRAIVIETLQALGASFTHAQALAALAPLKAAGTLGSGSPASYIGAFVKCGYLVPVAA